MLAIECATPTLPVTLPACLYSSCGKLEVEITTLGDDRATVCASERPAVGSFAYLVRNRVKVPAMIAWAAGDVLGLSFQESMNDAWWKDVFRSKR